MLMRGQAEILIAYETVQKPCGIPAPIASRAVLGVDKLILVANPALHASLDVPGDSAAPVPMLCFPPESFFGQVVRFEVMPELMRRQPVVVRCVSEFAMGLRELALAGQGAAWLPASLIADDLKRGKLLSLESLGREVCMDIVAYFAVQGGDKGDLLQRQYQALRDATGPLPPAAMSGKDATSGRGRRLARPPRAR